MWTASIAPAYTPLSPDNNFSLRGFLSRTYQLQQPVTGVVVSLQYGSRSLLSWFSWRGTLSFDTRHSFYEESLPLVHRSRLNPLVVVDIFVVYCSLGRVVEGPYRTGCRWSADWLNRLVFQEGVPKINKRYCSVRSCVPPSGQRLLLFCLPVAKFTSFLNCSSIATLSCCQAAQKTSLVTISQLFS